MLIGRDHKDMLNLRPILAMGVFAGILVGCTGATPAASNGGGTVTPTPVTGQASSAVSSAPASPGAGGGSAHYDISGPGSASGDIPFFNSTLVPKFGTRAAAVAMVIFTPKAGDPSSISLTFPAPSGPTGCSIQYPQQCGLVSVSSPTLTVQDAGWRGLPAPAGPTCTWDTTKLTAHGGTGSVECTNGLNLTKPSAGAYHIKVSFTYNDPNPIQR